MHEFNKYCSMCKLQVDDKNIPLFSHKIINKQIAESNSSRLGEKGSQNDGGMCDGSVEW